MSINSLNPKLKWVNKILCVGKEKKSNKLSVEQRQIEHDNVFLLYMVNFLKLCCHLNLQISVIKLKIKLHVMHKITGKNDGSETIAHPRCELSHPLILLQRDQK